jgi:tetratricopeptide (TPR) repeat protein
VAGLVLLVGTLGVTTWSLQRARADREAARQQTAEAQVARDEAEAGTRFITGLLESVEPGAPGGGRTVTVLQVLDRAAKQLADSEKQSNEPSVDDPLLRARLHLTMGRSYHALGVLDKARTHLETSLALREKALGSDARLTLRSRFNLAALMFDVGEFDAAKASYEHCLRVWRQASYADEESVLGATNNLAQIMGREGAYEKAEVLQRDVITRAERTLGETHEHTLGMKVNLGLILKNLGKYEESQRVITAAETAWRTAHGADHPGTLLCLHNLADLAGAQGDYERAASIGRRLVEARTRVLGPDHHDTLAASANLGRDLMRFDPQAAEQTLLPTWKRARELLGEAHEITIAAALNLSDVWGTLGWPERSREALAQVVASIKAQAQSQNASAHNCNASAWLLLTLEPESMRDVRGGLEAATRACDIERRNGGRELWQYLDTLALAYSLSGNAASAVAAQTEALQRLPEDPGSQRYKGEMTERLRAYESKVK